MLQRKADNVTSSKADSDPISRSEDIQPTAENAPGDLADTATSGTGRVRMERVLMFLSAATFLLSVVVLVAAVYTWNAVRQVRAVNSELADLAQFESRINDRLDRFNTGIQSIMDATNNRLSVLQGQIDDVVGGAQTGVASFQSGMSRTQSPPYARSFFIPDENKFHPYDPSNPRSGDQAGHPGQASSPQGEGTIMSVFGSNTQYHRIVGSDGSVTYERIR